MSSNKLFFVEFSTIAGTALLLWRSRFV